MPGSHGSGPWPPQGAAARSACFGEVPVDAGVEYGRWISGVVERAGVHGGGEEGEGVVVLESEKREVGTQGGPGGGVGEPVDERVGMAVDPVHTLRADELFGAGGERVVVPGGCVVQQPGGVDGVAHGGGCGDG